jgi:hypothetical protein
VHLAGVIDRSERKTEGFSWHDGCTSSETSCKDVTMTTIELIEGAACLGLLAHQFLLLLRTESPSHRRSVSHGETDSTRKRRGRVPAE